MYCICILRSIGALTAFLWSHRHLPKVNPPSLAYFSLIGNNTDPPKLNGLGIVEHSDMLGRAVFSHFAVAA